MKNTKTHTDTGILIPVIIIGSLFFIFGFITWLNSILIPYLKIACELTGFQSLLVAFVFYISFTIMALPSAWVLKQTGLKNGMMVGLWIMAMGTLLFLPAAYTRTFWVFLAGLYVMGTGLALLQTAANPYVTILGPRNGAARRISIMGVCNKTAGAIAPLVLAYFILNDGNVLIESLQTLKGTTSYVAALDDLALRVVNPYLVMTIVLFGLGIIIRFSPLPDIKTGNDREDQDSFKKKGTIFDFPHLILGAVALFVYMGLEVIAGDTIIQYGLSHGMEIDQAKGLPSYTMAAMIVGYLMSILLIPKYVSQRTVLSACSFLGIFFSIGIIMTSGWTSVAFVALLGFSNAIVWPAIWPLALHNLGNFTNQGAAILIMAISGGAIIPLLWGQISDSFGPQEAYWILIPSHLIIAFYALKGYRVLSWKGVKN